MCTDFLLKATDGSVVNGRSMEFGIDLKSELISVGRGTELHSEGPGFKSGLLWKAKYGYIGLNALNLPMLVDGQNEAGLSTGCLWLPRITHYARNVQHSNRALSMEHFASWILSNFSSVEEVKEGLTQIEPWGTAELESIMPLHFPVHDKTGKSIVIEFTNDNGEAVVYDNPIGVLTNAPAFPWHVTNIQNYVGLQAEDAEPIVMGGKHFQPPGLGSGLRGIPGDSTPPSRFIRTAFLKHFATPPITSAEACNLALHLLNAVDIPRGTSISQPNVLGKKEADYTQWITIKDLATGTYSVRTYDNLTLRRIHLASINLNAPITRIVPIPQAPTAFDVDVFMGH